MRQRPSKRGNEDVLAGLFFISIGLAGLWLGRGLAVGSAREMGEGFFPLVMSVLLIGLGIAIAATGVWRASAPVERIAWRAPLLVTLAVLVFAVALEGLGVAIAVALCVIVASIAGGSVQVRRVLILAMVLAAIVLAVFVWGLGLPLRALPAWLR